MSDLMLDVDQAGELKAAFRRGDWTNAEIKRACEGNFLAQVREVLLGRAEIKTVSHTIDCDADPFVPEDWKVEEHKKGGRLLWDLAKVELFLSENQKDGNIIVGNKLRKELADKPVLNANVLDWLLAHPQLIPEEWKGKYIFFWGTIYRDSSGDLGVRCLYFYDGEWRWSVRWLGHDWHDLNPAALLASLSS
ncbi:MAG: hypothetical protein AAB740_03555 [Patescibacteria group bacterium]